MLRGIHEVDGPGVYIRALCDALFDIESPHKYYAYYMSKEEVGRYSQCDNVVERAPESPSKLIWDQAIIPFVAARDEIDVLFHHKFTIPLVAPGATVVEQQGAEYWTHPEWYGRLERWHAKVAIPLYCKSADKVLSISRSLAKQLSTRVGIPSSEIEHIYAAPDRRFRPIENGDRISAVRRQYALPDERFFLMVAKGYSSATVSGEDFYPRKNVGGVLRAYRHLLDEHLEDTVPPLVVAGPGFDQDSISRYLESADRDLGGKISFPGLVNFDDMPVLYTLAEALLFPSYSESFGIPLVEAMACGCPVVASNTTSCPEVVGDAGLLVDPHSPHQIADAMSLLIESPDKRDELALLGLNRANQFSWEKSAKKLLGILEGVAR